MSILYENKKLIEFSEGTRKQVWRLCQIKAQPHTGPKLTGQETL